MSLDGRLGYIPSKPDARDYRVVAFLPQHIDTLTFPNEYRVPVEVPVHNQGNVGQCVAFTLAEIKEAQEVREQGTFTHWSTNFIYGNRSQSDYQGEGMVPREALAHLVEDGVPSEEDFAQKMQNIRAPLTYPQIDWLRKQYPTLWEQLRQDGQPQRILAYVRAIGEQEIKAALMQLGPCLLAIDVHESFFRTGNDGIVPQPDGNVVGGHAMMLVGWKQIGGKTYWIIQNSWGDGWGDKGFCYLPADYRAVREVWTVTDLQNVRTFVDVPPDDYAALAIDRVHKAGLMRGYPDGTFRPDQQPTRRELAVILDRLLQKWGG